MLCKCQRRSWLPTSVVPGRTGGDGEIAPSDPRRGGVCGSSGWRWFPVRVGSLSHVEVSCSFAMCLFVCLHLGALGFHPGAALPSEGLLGTQRPEDQRLIYSGKLLLDNQYLRDLLPKQETRHVLHLVCSVKSPSKMPETSAKVAESTEQPAGPTQGQYPGDSSSDGVRLREPLRNLSPSGWENISRPEAAQPAFQGLGPGFSGYTTYGWLQLSWFQQIYARQYYMQYLAATAASGTFVPSPSAQEIPVVSAPAPAPIHNQFPAENQPANQNAAPQVVVNPGANQNLRMNAQGGPLVEEDDEINRDWLDWTYSAATFSVFLSILYFYSSLSRFLMVMGATVVMYLHHVGWFPFRQRPVQNFPNDRPRPEAANQDPNNNLQEGPEAEIENPNRLPPDRNVVDGEQTSPSFMSTAWLVFKTFFASLLPEGPPAIAN